MRFDLPLDDALNPTLCAPNPVVVQSRIAQILDLSCQALWQKPIAISGKLFAMPSVVAGVSVAAEVLVVLLLIAHTGLAELVQDGFAVGVAVVGVDAMTTVATEVTSRVEVLAHDCSMIVRVAKMAIDHNIFADVVPLSVSRSSASPTSSQNRNLMELSTFVRNLAR